MRNRTSFCLLTILFVMSAVGIKAQTNEFSYQGKLVDSAGTAATYDLQFALYASSSGAGLPIGTRDRLAVPVSGGAFTVTLDFPATNFNGSDRWLEIRVKPAGSGGGYTTLAPRQRITSSPYSVRSAIATNADSATNSAQLGGVNANQFVQTNDSRLTDARIPLPGSDNYVRNNPELTGQPINFNITGYGLIGGNALVGGALTVNGTQLSLGGGRFLSNAGLRNTFSGINTGPTNTGADNSLFGFNAGNGNTTGVDNSFFGSDAGGINSTGNRNSFFGSDTGDSNTTGSDNSFFGRNAGSTNTTGNGNSYFGSGAGSTFSTGNAPNAFNTFIGANTDIVSGAGPGDHVTLIGAGAKAVGSGSNYGTAIGAGAEVWGSNSIVLGRRTREDVVVTYGLLISDGGASFENVAGSDYSALFYGRVYLERLGAAGGGHLCRNSENYISSCFSPSLNSTTNIKPFNSGLNLVNRLQPISFNWKNGGKADFGLGAEDVAAVEPQLVTFNSKGEIDEINYDRLSVVLLNAVKEQQKQIEEQKKQIGTLRTALCQSNPQLTLCADKELQK